MHRAADDLITFGERHPNRRGNIGFLDAAARAAGNDLELRKLMVELTQCEHAHQYLITSSASNIPVRHQPEGPLADKVIE